MQVDQQKSTMPAPIDVYKQVNNGLDPNFKQRLLTNNMDIEDKASTCASVANKVHEEPFNSIKEYHGKEWSEVEHLLKVPADSEKDNEEDYYEWSPASTQSSDSHDDPLAEDIHDLVNVLDNVIRSHSNLRCDATRVVDYLDLDISKYETILADVRNWNSEAETLIEEPVNLLGFDPDIL